MESQAEVAEKVVAEYRQIVAQSPVVDHVAIDTKVQTEAAKAELFACLKSVVGFISENRQTQFNLGLSLVKSMVKVTPSILDGKPETQHKSTLTKAIAGLCAEQFGGKPEDYTGNINAVLTVYYTGKKIESVGGSTALWRYKHALSEGEAKAISVEIGITRAAKARQVKSDSQKADSLLVALHGKLLVVLIAKHLPRAIASMTTEEVKTISAMVQAECKKREPLPTASLIPLGSTSTSTKK